MTNSTSASTMLPDQATSADGTLRFYRHQVTPEIFQTLGIPLLVGRGFSTQDSGTAPRVAIINDVAAQRIWGTVNVTGRHFRVGGVDGTPVEIVGVVGTARFRDLTTDLGARGVEPDIYFPFAQSTSGALEIAVRTADGSAVPSASLQRAVAQLDAGLPVFGVQLLEDVIRRQTSAERFVSVLLTIFSAATLLLAAVGLYGLMAYVVGLSRREIAIRLALGANRFGVGALIVRNGMIVVLMGLAVGVVGAIGAGRAIQTQLFATSAADPVTLAAVGSLLLAVTFVASLLPTMRAVSLNPQAALRAD
jgi:hypothetical protein